MSEKQETIADIVAEMKALLKQERLAPIKMETVERGHATIFGKPVSIFLHELTDRIEAAHKRDIEAYDLINFMSPVGRAKPAPVGNGAKMREALVLALSLLDLKEGVPYKTVSQKDLDFMKDALAEPRKNCERFQTWDEAKDAYWREQGDPCDWRKLGAWLFAPEKTAQGSEVRG